MEMTAFNGTENCSLVYKLAECYGLALRQVASPRPLTMDTLVQFHVIGGNSGTGTHF